jgi:hypothetical protein
LNLFNRNTVWKNLAVNARFTHSARDELSVLAAKVEYDYVFVARARQKRKASMPGGASKISEIV